MSKDTKFAINFPSYQSLKNYTLFCIAILYKTDNVLTPVHSDFAMARSEFKSVTSIQLPQAWCEPNTDKFVKLKKLSNFLIY